MRLRWLKILFSPFKPFKIACYVGKTKIGVPYFLPRKVVKSKTRPGYLEFAPRKVGFNYCSLGWKIKWRHNDYRHEWNPVLSFVFYGYQIAFTFYHKHDSQHWEAWLYYEYATDKSKSRRERVAECRQKFPQTWIVSAYGEVVTTDYYTKILKRKYNDWKSI